MVSIPTSLVYGRITERCRDSGVAYRSLLHHVFWAWFVQRYGQGTLIWGSRHLTGGIVTIPESSKSGSYLMLHLLKCVSTASTKIAISIVTLQSRLFLTTPALSSRQGHAVDSEMNTYRIGIYSTRPRLSAVTDVPISYPTWLRDKLGGAPRTPRIHTV
jgi:hypothetical protein